MATHLTWSDSVGKRVRTGDWADQAISTAVKVEEELRAGGNDLGLAGGRRENAAQLVDYFMEEAKVVYVIYKVWTAGFEDWLIQQGVTRADLDVQEWEERQRPDGGVERGRVLGLPDAPVGAAARYPPHASDRAGGPEFGATDALGGGEPRQFLGIPVGRPPHFDADQELHGPPPGCAVGPL